MLTGYIGTNRYRWRSFYVKLTNTTKLLIDGFLDERSGYMNMSEINFDGKIDDEDFIRGIAELKVDEIESWD